MKENIDVVAIKGELPRDLAKGILELSVESQK